MSAFLLSPVLRRGGRIPPWTCRTCLRSSRQTRGLPQQQSTFATSAETAARPIGKKSGIGRKRLLVLGGGVALGAAAVTYSEDARHASAAAQRTYRVAATLALNIKECVCFFFLKIC